MHEASLYKANCFVTLTYDEAHRPAGGRLDYAEFQRFLRRLRKHFAPTRVRFYMCGEYGSELGRPHYHACLFGVDFDDRMYQYTTAAGARLYRSPTLERLWPLGISSVGQLTFESAAYTARYCVQKVTGPDAKAHYFRPGEEGPVLLEPEFNHASLKPGIGAGWLDRWESDVYPSDTVVVNGKECVPPRYYRKRFQRRSAFAAQLVEDELGFRRETESRSRYADNTPARLAAKEEVAAARARFLIRSFDHEDYLRGT